MTTISSARRDETRFLEKLPARFNSMDAGHWSWDPAGGRVTFSGEWTRMFGYGSGPIEVNSGTWEAMVHPLDRPRVLRRWKAFLDGADQSAVFEYRLREKSGGFRWVLSRATKHFDERGRLALVAGTHLDLSEFKAAEETLLFTRFSVDRGAFAVLWWDDEGLPIYVNDAACLLLGCPREALGELRIDTLGIDAGAWAELKAEKVLVMDVDVRRRDGSTVTLELHATWMDYGGREYACAAAIDVRQRREAESALRRQQRLFRDLTDNIREVFYVSETSEPRILYVSPAYEEIWGRSREELYRDIHAFLKPVHPEDLPRVREAFDAERDGKGYDLEYRLLRPDGSVRWVHDRGFPVKGPEGAYRTVGVAEDITERKTTEEALRASERRFRRMLEENPDTVLLHDGHKILYINPAGVRLLGARSAEEIVGRPALDIVHPDYKEAVAERIRRAASGASPANPTMEQKILRLDGGVVDVESVGVPHVNEDGFGVQVVLRDITARKRLERQFQEAQKMEAIGRLAGGVAHDFNNLLTVISGYASVAAEQLRPEDPLSAPLQEILRASERASGLTRQLLAFSRHQVMSAKHIDLNALVGGMEGMLRRLIGEDIRLETRLAADLGAVHADPGQIEQVIMNLVVNARDAMPAGGTIAIETGNVPAPTAGTGLAPGPYTRLSVVDTGVGMSKEILARLFEPFFTTKEKGKGTGLGLPTSYGIVRQSGGHIAVESEPGRGSRFHVYLPRVQGAVAAAEEAKSSSSRLAGHETILLVEDDAVVRALSARILRGQGYELLEARDAEEALRLAEGGREASLLLSDVILPGMPGTRLADLLRARHPALRVLLVSGYTEDALLQSGGLPEGMRLLTKPFLPRALLEKVREVLDAPA